MSFTSDEVNYLVYRYLLESGFSHSTFTFLQESSLRKSDIKGSHVKPGALINIIQKGLQYLEVEAHVNQDGTEKRCAATFSLIGPHECEPLEDDHPKRKLQDVVENTKDRKRLEKKAKKDQSQIDEFNKQVSLYTSPEVRTMNGHESEVFACCWNPVYDLLATGSGDGTARIWHVPMHATDILQNDPIVLVHESRKAESKDVTTLDWDPTGEYLATGSYDGQARIWFQNGELKFCMLKHQGPIFSLRWNKQGDLLLTGSVDKIAIIWDANTGEPRQQFDFHTAPILDVDWKDNTTFASCATDSHIYVCQIGSPEPLKHFLGHRNEVNAVRWDPSGTLLASCSDDGITKIWTLEQEEQVHELRGHTKEIYTLRWSPVIGSKLVATASFDATVRVWDANQGQCLHILQGHKEAIYSVSWAPSGLYLTSGSFDKCINLWSLSENVGLIKSFEGNGGIFELTWHRDGNRVAACYADNTVVVVYLKDVLN